MSRSLPVLNYPLSLRTPNDYPIAVTPGILEQLKAGAVVAMGVSGGKDSSAMAFALMEYLDRIGHTGTRVLIHSNLGLIEWRESLTMCEQLAQRLGLELIVVHKDMIARWKQRQQNNIRRYEQLECVKLVMPWSSAQWKFCTGEQKLAPVSSELTRRFPFQVILSASGIRHDESNERKKAAVSKEQPKLLRKKLGTRGYDWHPIIEWSLEDVFSYHQEKAIPFHNAYKMGSTRVSCTFCVLSSQHNLAVATLCEANHKAYRELVSIEIASTFSFQSGSWLGGVAPHLLDQEMREALADAKRRAHRREQAESRLPKHLLYQKGWPIAMPTWEEARLLSEVRKEVAEAVRLDIHYTTPAEIRDRYSELINLHLQRAAS